MKKYIFFLFSLFTFLLFTSFGTDADKDWKLEKNKNGISVFSFVSEGETLKEIKTLTIVHSSIVAIVSVLLDVKNYPNWIYNCSESYYLKKINSYEMIY